MKSSFETHIKEFADHLRLERSLSKNTISSYCSDLKTFAAYLDSKGVPSFEEVSSKDVEAFISEKFTPDTSP